MFKWLVNLIKKLMILLTFFSPFVLLPDQSCAQDQPKPLEPAELKSWWMTARNEMEQEIHSQQRSILDLESPKWYEVPYNTIGRMPLIETCLRQPLTQPEIALWADEEAAKSSKKLALMFELAEKMATEMAIPEWTPPETFSADWITEISTDLTSTRLPDQFQTALTQLIGAAAQVSFLRDQAFSSMSSEEKERLRRLIPGYFVRQTPQGEMIRGYTTNVDDCIELIDLLTKCDFALLLEASRLAAHQMDCFLDTIRQIRRDELALLSDPVIYRKITPLGEIIIGGAGSQTYRDDYFISIDVSGDDLYLNHPAMTSMDTAGCSIHLDLEGNDVYRSEGMSQGCAIAGITVFTDLSGDDQYFSGHYSQGAALCGTSFFLDDSGDDLYEADLGVQCFSIFGTSIFLERNGKDSYRCAANGQGSASTLGVSIMVEEGGDDVYCSGGKYGFYATGDSSCAQGAASGMRPWPPTGKKAVYGGIGFLCERSGNDTYQANIIGQGGSYVFALGMLVDSRGNDTYSAERYTRGVGVHLSAAVAIDKDGNDLYNGFYGNNGYSLDRSSGVFVDFAGQDIYRTSGGIGFGHKPKGCGIFVDVSGNDVYGGWENNYGKADYPFGDEAYSSGFFLDYNGNDVYKGEMYSNDSIWREGSFGYGHDMNKEKPDASVFEAWYPMDDNRVAESPKEKDQASMMARLSSSSPLVRLTALNFIRQDLMSGLKAIASASASTHPAVRRHLIDVIQMLVTDKMLKMDHLGLLNPLLEAEDYDMRILGLHAIRLTKTDDPVILHRIGDLVRADPDVEVRAMAALTIGILEWKDGLSYLETALKDPSWHVRRRAAIGLASLKDDRAAKALADSLRSDPAFQVRGHAAIALGELKLKEYEGVIHEALSDPSEFVRAAAAQQLVTHYNRAQAIDVLIDLMDWNNWPMKEQWVYTFLTEFTGQSIPPQRDPWNLWWQNSSQKFNVRNHNDLARKVSQAQEYAESGKTKEAIDLYRKIHEKLPGHSSVVKNLSELLNAEAWEIAVAGIKLEHGLRLARESVSVQKTAMNLDTLAVLEYLLDQKSEAIQHIIEAVKIAPDSEKPVYQNRQVEFETGQINLR